MKNKLVTCLLVGLIALAGCNGDGNDNNLPKPPTSSQLAEEGYAMPNLPRITAEELKIKYGNKESYILIDARPHNSYLEGYIPGARNIPNNPWDESFNELAKLPKDRLIVTYCDCIDDDEAAIAANRLILSGYDDVKILWKGIYAWKNIGGELRQ